jgi:hypothetical protein
MFPETPAGLGLTHLHRRTFRAPIRWRQVMAVGRGFRATLLGAVLGALVVAAPICATPAVAGLVSVDYAEKDGTWVEEWVDKDGYHAWFFYVDYKMVEVEWAPPGNPTPDDAGRDPGDLKTKIALAKKRGARIEKIETPFGKSPVGRERLANGEGLEPVYNPPETGFEGEGDGIGGGGFDPGGGSLQEQLKKRAKHGSGNGGKGDDGSDLKPGDVGLFDDSMPGPPPLVNPNPVATPTQLGKSLASGEHGGGSSGGGNSGGTGGGAGHAAGG